jgi:hypothetical protein
VRNQYDHDLKLYQALQHTVHLKTEVERWLGGNPYSLTIEFDPQRRENALWINALRSPPDEFSLIIGECLHNLRSALDNLVHTLAIRKHGSPLPQTIAKRLQFPIAKDHEGFRGIKWRIQDIPSEAQTEIEGLQPYNHRQDDPTRDPLWILNELSNIDKHRLPQLTLFALASTGFGGSARVKLGRQREVAAVEDRAKLFSFGARRDEPSRKVDIEFNLEGSIAFAGPVAQGADVFEILPAIRDKIVDEVLPSLSRFLPPLPLP